MCLNNGRSPEVAGEILDVVIEFLLEHGVYSRRLMPLYTNELLIPINEEERIYLGVRKGMLRVIHSRANGHDYARPLLYSFELADPYGLEKAVARILEIRG